MSKWFRYMMRFLLKIKVMRKERSNKEEDVRKEKKRKKFIPHSSNCLLKLCLRLLADALMMLILSNYTYDRI